MQETSLAAYRSEVRPTLGDRQRAAYSVLCEAHAEGKNMTNSEIAATLNWKINTVTPRINELRKVGKVRGDGLRTCNVTGRTVHAWTPCIDGEMQPTRLEV